MGLPETDPRDQEGRWLAEYREVLADHRHHDVLRWTVVGLTYPTAFAAAAWAGSRWGLTSGRTALVLAGGSLWLLTGSLLFAQVHFMDRVRMVRLWELEDEHKLGFANVSHAPFTKPLEPKAQPWYTRDLALWFAVVFPLTVVIAWVLAGFLILLGWHLPSTSVERETLAMWAAFMLFFAIALAFILRAAHAGFRAAKEKREAVGAAEPADRADADMRHSSSA